MSRQGKCSKERRMFIIRKAQGKICHICGDRLEQADRLDFERAWTMEHVWPRRRYRFTHGNTLVAHRSCNHAKADRDPTGCELIMLLAANAKLNRTLAEVERCEYVDAPPATPSPMQLAWKAHVEQRAREGVRL